MENRIERKRMSNVNNKTLSIVKNDKLKPVPFSLRDGSLPLLPLSLGPILEKLSSVMSILVWVLNCLQSLGIPQDNKEPSLKSSPLAKSQSWCLGLVSFNYDEVVRLASAPLLDDVERDGPVVFNLKWRVFSRWQKGDHWDERYKVLASDRSWTHFLWFPPLVPSGWKF